MYSIEKELKILRQFVKLEHMDNAEGWRCYSEDELTAAEERLRAKLPLPIREIYLYMADLLISSNYLRPLELVHWDKDYLAFFENPNADKIVGIKRDDPSDDLYEWEETDPQDIAWEYEDDFRDAYEEQDTPDKKGQKKAAGRFQKYWEKLNANPKHSPLRIAKWKNEPRYNRSLDGYGLFLVINALCGLAEMTKHSFPDEPACYFCEAFASHTAEYFQDLDRRIRKEFVPLSAHSELLEMEVPVQMVYARQNPDALLISQDILLIFLTKTPPEQTFLENIQELTGLPLCAGL